MFWFKQPSSGTHNKNVFWAPMALWPMAKSA